MRKKTILIFTVLLFLTCFINVNSTAAQTFAEPKDLHLNGYLSEAEKAENQLHHIEEGFYPIGWSKDGKFAYLLEPPDEACGCYFANLIVQDMRTDKILWNNSYVGSEGADENIKSHWRKNQKSFSRKLAQYKIVPNKNFKLLDSSLAVGKDSVKIDLNSTVELADDLYSSTGNIVLKLISKQKGSKIVYQKTYKGEGSDGIIEIKKGGVLLSPFESRAAVILIEIKRGWEGPPHTANVRIVGADLIGGFRP